MGEFGDGGPRYVSLVPSLTETLFALGVGPQVVGATKFCVHPREGADHLVRVGGTKDPRVDRIVSLRPTHVFVNQEENRREDVEALRAAGVPVHVSFPRRVVDVAPMLEEVAGVVDRVARGKKLAKDLEQAIAAAGPPPAASPASATLRAPRFLVLVWRKPWIGASSDTFLSDLLETAGGVNALPHIELGKSAETSAAHASGAPRYPELTAQQIGELAPDVLILPSEPYPFRPEHGDEVVRCARIDGVRIVFCDGELLTWHGVRTAQGLRASRGWLHPTVT